MIAGEMAGFTLKVGVIVTLDLGNSLEQPGQIRNGKRKLLFLLALVLLWPIHGPAEEQSLAIINAGVSALEDAPPVSTDFSFLPGEYVYLTFQVAGFQARADKNSDARLIEMSYEATMQDAARVTLSPMQPGDIKVQVGTEDKDWVPKRRASFLIPSLIAAGVYDIHVDVKDLLGNQSAAKDVSFRVGGEHVTPSERVTIENFRFLREQDSREALSIPAYRPGDTIFTAFDIVGFTLARNQYHVAYGLMVLSPDGKTFLNEAQVAELEDSRSYPVQFLPETINVVTKPSSRRGEYLMVFTVHDVIGKQSYELKQAFRLE